ncbi:MAG: SufD family Fe-S cluster assembly protein, partial [Treponema sp.]|nr:SufD family Fe-S cluster assembly protein [Treponema sp.]
MMGEIMKDNWYDMMKARARSLFATGHWPLVTEEEWRRSDVSKLGLDAFIGGAGRDSAAFSASLPPGALSAGVRLSPARDLSAVGPESSSAAALRAHIESSLDQGDRFAAWNLAEGEAWVLELPEGFVATEPIVVDCAISGRAAHPRLMVAAGPGSQADIVYRLTANAGAATAGVATAGVATAVAAKVGVGSVGAAQPTLPGPRLVNSVVGLRLGEGAIVKFFESRESDDEALWFVEEKASLSRDARLLHFTVDSSGRFVKSRVECALEGSGADADLDGIFYGSSGRQIDLRTVQRHVAPRATSRALYKGALDWGGRSVFQGLIEVAKEASGT